ncbi:sigma-70 family RNA polymerase sigma factor [Streptomyces phyllanthi]|uniref:RNA polymerase sigma factor n=1 Tax=Streptomyces phyllanthi TaxID=1803180 RepID=A0A5N8WI92_9ACTN|nr:sigma-70 family RNA polymerase sigma factor [Streptomyces phyllanthi]MPY46616.1 sigma-70 family RNA polymerase sigma factor [Streptomyces phyllanthi]
MQSQQNTTTCRPDDRERAFAQDIYRRHSGALLSFARKLTFGDTHAAEDLVQEAFVRAWRHAERLTAAPDLARPWLFTVVRRLAIDVHRARSIRPEAYHDRQPEPRPVSDGVEETLTSHVMARALARMTPSQREVLVHRYLLDLSVQETASELNIPTGTVKSRSSHAVRALRRTLAADGVPGFEPRRRVPLASP